MISGLGVGNVRSFATLGWHFPLSPLVALCGTNSAGKSTLLKALMVLRDSVDPGAGSAPGQLSFSAEGIDVGGLQAFATENDLSRDVELGVDVTLVMSPSAVAWWLALAQGTPVPHSQSALLEGTTPEQVVFSARWHFRGVDGPPGSHELAEAAFSLRTHGEDLSSWEVIRDREAGPHRFVLKTRHLLFDRAFSTYGDYQYARYARGTDDVRVAVELRGLLVDGVLAEAPRQGDESQEALIRLPLPQQLSRPYDRLRRALASIQYLGPLRTPAERYYLATSGARTTQDVAGSFVPYALRDRGHQTVRYVNPDGAETEESLLTAVNRWLHFLRTGVSVSSDDDVAEELAIAATKEVLVEVELSDAAGADRYPLADSGFGYSQLLPILIRGLELTKGATLIVEQPELHLHPALQIRLATFFLGMARANRQVLIETHSEHLINAFRVAAAEDHSGDLARLSRLYFIDGEVHPPHVHELSISADGTVPDWPPSFFGEALSLSGRLLRAQRRHLEEPPS